MRIALVILFAIIAIGAAGVWALGQFGPALTASEQAQVEPLVREPEVPPAAAEPQQQLRTRSTEAAPPPPTDQTATSQPATTSTPEAIAPPPVAPADPAAPPAEAGANDGKPQTRALSPERLDTGGASTGQAPADPTVAPAQAPPAADPAPATRAASATTTAEPGIAQQYKSRRVTYNRPPKTLVLDRPVDISLVINATDDLNAGQEALQGFPGTVVERDIDLSDFVSAELAGTDFDIQLQTTSPRQKLSPKIPNQWRWRVRPTKTGEHTLTLTIYGYASGSLDAEPLDSYRDVINVEVKEFDKVINWARSVQPVFAGLAALAGALSAVFAFLRFREERKRNKAPPAA